MVITLKVLNIFNKMDMEDYLITTAKSGNKYLYADAAKYNIYIPNAFYETFGKEDSNDKSYYQQKLCFFKNHGLLEKENIRLTSKFNGEQVRKNLANLRQLLIEVTDGCNLKCKYCGYGEFYSNHDERRGINQTFENVKVIIDYLYDLWKSEYNITSNNVFTIGFYGGEPLLNMRLIKEVILYVEGLDTNGIEFVYYMTTNGMLLDRYADFIVQKQFQLLISLDGDEYGDSYRVDHHGNESFSKVLANIKKLKYEYPDYYDKHVSFNAVLHDRNSVARTVKFVQDTLDTPIRLSELNPLGIAKEKLEEFQEMFKLRRESFQVACKDEEIKKIIGDEDDETAAFRSMLLQYSGNHFMNYSNLFDYSIENEYHPTSTCRPFERKIFLTVNGKIFPCEKIGEDYPLGKLENGIIHLDCDKIAELYSRKYEEAMVSCKNCYSKRTCGQCMYFMPMRKGHLFCQNIMDLKYRQSLLSSCYTFAEVNPQQYDTQLSTIKLS